MTTGGRVWAGIDVGGAKKGFHLAVIQDDRDLVALEHRRCPSNPPAAAAEVVALLRDLHSPPAVIAVDSPAAAAADGERSRRCERQIAKSVCGIRWTPDRARLDAGSDYYGWIRNGFLMYEALQTHGEWRVIECFPTATLTRLHGPRGGRRRATWSRAPVQAWSQGDLWPRNQDQRDSVAAAWTAKLYDEHSVGAPLIECFEEGDVPFVVPLPAS